MNNKISKTKPGKTSPAGVKPALKDQAAFSRAAQMDETYDDQTTLNSSAMQEGFRKDLPKSHPHSA